MEKDNIVRSLKDMTQLYQLTVMDRIVSDAIENANDPQKMEALMDETGRIVKMSCQAMHRWMVEHGYVGNARPDLNTVEHYVMHDVFGTCAPAMIMLRLTVELMKNEDAVKSELLSDLFGTAFLLGSCWAIEALQRTDPDITVNVPDVDSASGSDTPD